MTDKNYSNENKGCFKESVCVDVLRIYDSCTDKDCLEDIRVMFSPDKQEFVNNSMNAKIKSVDVITVIIDVQPIPFKKGFFSADLTFFFDVCVELVGTSSKMALVSGISVFNKKVVMFGSESNIKSFTNMDEDCFGTEALPTVKVQVAEPVALGARICDCRRREDKCCKIPDSICKNYGCEFEAPRDGVGVYVTIGLFSIVQMGRNVQMLIPAYDFCIPTKECVSTSGNNPCDLFNTFDFPTDDFFPPVKDSNNCCC